MLIEDIEFKLQSLPCEEAHECMVKVLQFICIVNYFVVKTFIALISYMLNHCIWRTLHIHPFSM